MIDFSTIEALIIVLLIIAGSMIAAAVIDYLSRKTGRDAKKDIEQAADLIVKVKKALEDGKLTEEEIQEISEASYLLKDSAVPYIEYIANSGILKTIWNKLKKEA